MAINMMRFIYGLKAHIPEWKAIKILITAI